MGSWDAVIDPVRLSHIPSVPLRAHPWLRSLKKRPGDIGSWIWGGRWNVATADGSQDRSRPASTSGMRRHANERRKTKDEKERPSSQAMGEDGR